MCGDNAACWGFVCIPKQELGKPCTHDVHCLSKQCGDDRAALWCVSCTQDEQCSANQFCEVMVDQIAAGKYLQCQPLVSNDRGVFVHLPFAGPLVRQCCGACSWTTAIGVIATESANQGCAISILWDGV